jgi:pseudaminic acid cytidylyltransferase
MNVAIIPARGGSKRIPRKNIKLFFGKPMIAYSIEAAIKSKCFDKVIVSTDNKEIAEIARLYGAEVPFVRPAELSDDYAGTIPVIKHAIEYFLDKGVSIKNVCCIYATAPFISPDDLITGKDLLETENCDYILPVTTYAYPIQRSLKRNDTGFIAMNSPENWEVRSQDLDEMYHDVGQFYWGKKQSWLELIPILGEGAYPIIIPRVRALDIDTEEDWKHAELLYEIISI